MIIHLNENIFNKFFLLTESKNSSKAKSQTLAILAQALGTEPDSDIVISDEKNFRNEIFDSLHLTNKEYDRVIKYEPLFIKCALDVGYQLNTSFLKKYTDYIIFKTKDSENPSEVMSRYMGINSFMDLYRLVTAEMRADKEAGVEVEDNVQYTLNQNYDVLGPLSFDEAKVYGNESGNNGYGKICYTQGEGTWNSGNYSDKNQNKCYLLLRKDWKSVPCRHDGSQANNGLGELSKYNGYDDYGLSMIFLFINPYGMLHECNTRWNHEADYAPRRGVDHALNEEDIARLMGAPFEKVFGVKKTDPYAEINERIANDKSVQHLCEIGFYYSDVNGYEVIHEYNGDEKCNIITKDGKVIWKKPIELWFDSIGYFQNGFAVVGFGDKYNYINTEGKVISNIWFDGCYSFRDKFGKVFMDSRFNWIRRDGTLVWKHPVNEWFDEVSNFYYKGVAIVCFNHKFNFIREDGTLIWNHPAEEWFDSADFFMTDLTDVSFKGKPYKLSEDGKLYDVDGNFVSESKNSKKSLITESKNSSKAKNQTLAILSQVLETEPDNEEALKLEENFRKEIFDYLHLTNKEYDRVIKYEPLFMRCAIDVGYPYGSNFLFFKKHTKYIILKTKDSPNPSEVMYRYMSANSFMDLYRLVIADMKADKEAGVKLNDKAQYTFNQNYEVLGPLSFEESQEYGDESGNLSDSGTRICYTQFTKTWNSQDYSDHDTNKCYLLLRKDWESVPCRHDGSEANNGLGVLSEYNGYDNYGLSMIFVFITPNGELYVCNTRWNHEADYGPNRGVDNALTEDDISDLMGAPFENVFDVEKRDPFAEINEKISNGEPINHLVNYADEEHRVVYVNDDKPKYNILRDDGRVVFEKPVNLWFDRIYGFKEDGIGVVWLKGKCNFITEDGALIWNKPVLNWFDDVSNFKGEYKRVSISKKFNLLRTDGTFLWKHPVNEWFDFIGEPNNGISIVKLGKKYNFLREDETFVWDYPLEKWFDYACSFSEGIANVSFGNKSNYIRTDGTLVWNYPLEKWFDKRSYISDFENGIAVVEINKKYNFLREDGTLVWDYPPEKWFDEIDETINGIAIVKIDRKKNYLRTDGVLLWNYPVNEWFDSASEFENGFGCVWLNGKRNCIREDGTLLWDYPPEKWLDKAIVENNNCILITLNGKVNVLDAKGNFLSKVWFDGAGSFFGGYAIVKLNGKFNFIDTKGEILSKEWFDGVRRFDYGFAPVCLNKKWNYVDTKGDILSKEWFDEAYGFNFNHCSTVIRNRVEYKLTDDGKLYDKNGNLVSESKERKKSLLTESKNSSKAKNQTLAILANELETTADNEEVLSTEQEFRKVIFDSLHLTNKEYDRVIKYEPLFVKCAIDAGYPYNLDLSVFSKLTNHIIFKTKDSENPSEVMSRYMGANSFMDLYRIVTSEIRADKEASAEVEDDTQYNLNQNYDVLGPLTFEEVQAYGDESGDNGRGKICYTQNGGTWNGPNYSNNDRNKCYLLLRKDWKVVPCTHNGSEVRNGLDELSEYNGYDNYGLSMIFVFITPYGELHECNTRWNHEAKYGPGRGVDHALTENDIANLMGAPFEKVFGVKKTDPYADINERIANDEPINGLVSNLADYIVYCVVNNKIKVNHIDGEGRAVWKKPVNLWFDAVDFFRNGFSRVVLNGKYNFINEEGKLISKRWYDKNSDFHEGFGGVKLGKKWNYINSEGKILSPMWFDDIYAFKDGFGEVVSNDKLNLIDTNGKLISDLWFDEAIISYYNNNLIKVSINKKNNIFSTKTKSFVWNHPVEEWFDYLADFENNDVTKCRLNGRFFKLTIDGKLYDEDGRFISESVHRKPGLIVESKNSSKAKSQTLAVLSQSLGIDPDSEEALNIEANFRKKIFDELHLQSSTEYDRVIKYEPMFMRCALDVMYPYNANLSVFKKYTTYVIFKTKDSPNPSEIMSRYRDIGTFMELKRVVDIDINADREKNNDKDIEVSLNQNYDVLGPLSFNEAQEYGNESGDNGYGKICYTQGEGTWNGVNYSDNGMNNCFLLLRKDWKTVPCEHDGSEANNGLDELSEYNGYDDYGLSMIFVFIEPNGALHECNTRWNHEANYGPGRGVDHALNEEDIARLMGAPFEKVFNVERIDFYKDINELIYNGKSVKDFCEVVNNDTSGLKIIRYKGKFNYMRDDGTLLWNRFAEYWFDKAFSFVNGFAKVKMHGMYNLISTEGKFISRKWYSWIGEFNGKIVKVHDGDKGFNIIDANGNLLHNTWFSWVFKEVEGFSKVERDSVEWNFIDEEGHLIGDTWYSEVDDFNDGLARVCLRETFSNVEVEKWNYIDRHGDTLLKQWFDNVGTFNGNVGVVTLNGEQNVVDREGNLYSNIWFDEFCGMTDDGIMTIRKGKLFNFINPEGKLVWDRPVNEWFNNCSYFYDGYAKVKIYDLGENLLTLQGTFVSDVWYDWVGDFGIKDGYAIVARGEEEFNVMNLKGQILSKMWFNEMGRLSNGYFRVGKNDKCNFIDLNGDLLLNYWLDGAGNFLNGFAIINNEEGEYNYINTQGNVISDIWFNYANNFNKNGYAVVECNNKFNLIKGNGHFALNRPVDEWFDYIATTRDNELVGQLGDNYYNLTKNRRLISDYDNGI